MLTIVEVLFRNRPGRLMLVDCNSQKMEDPLRNAIASTFAVAMLAASSLAFAADNNATINNDDATRDPQTTGSVNTEGRTVSPQFREFCNTNPSDSMCQGLGGEMNQQ